MLTPWKLFKLQACKKKPGTMSYKLCYGRYRHSKNCNRMKSPRQLAKKLALIAHEQVRIEAVACTLAQEDTKPRKFVKAIKSSKRSWGLFT